MNKALRTVLIILLLPFALIFLCTAVTSLRAGWRHYGAMAYADTIATQLGYTQQTHLVKERRCYNSWIDGETCEAVIMFTSPLDKEHFDQQVQAVNTGEHLYFGVKPVESDFSDLFYLISSLDKPVLTIDGRIPEHDDSISRWAATQWFYGASGANIQLYEISSLGFSVQLNGLPFRNNIVVVETTMGRISIFAQLYYLFTGWEQPTQSASIAETMHTLANRPDTTLVALLDNNIVRPGELIRLDTALIAAGQLEPTETLTGTLLSPDGAIRPLTFQDNGNQGDIAASDGVYATQFNVPLAAGRSTILLHGTSEALGYETQMDIYTVPLTHTAIVQEVLRERPMNVNNDGFLEALEFDLRVAISATGDYYFAGSLTGSDNQYPSYATTSLQVSHNDRLPIVKTLTLRFPDTDVRRLGVDGPYTITTVKVRSRSTLDTVAGVPLPKPHVYIWEHKFPINYKTTAYDLTQFADEATKARMYFCGSEEQQDRHPCPPLSDN